MEEKIYFNSSDGIKLCGVWTTPEKPTTKVIILAHGITVDKDEDGIFIELAAYLAQNGFVVFRFDFRGHGESDGKSIDVTLTGEIQDLGAAVQQVKSKGYQDIGLLGASFAGAISVLYVVQHPREIQHLCLWNPVLNYDHCYLHPTLPSLVKRKGHMMQEIKEQGWTQFGSHKFKVGKKLFDEMKQTFPYKAIKNLDCPTIIIHSDIDTYVPYEDSLDAVREKPSITLVTIKNAAHGFYDSVIHAQEAYKTTLDFLA
ncbi:MAG: alpha/beta fold hydrolase [Patescibacteria group bacterium]|jgi:hypothetical protein